MSTAVVEIAGQSFQADDFAASVCRESFWEFCLEFWEEIPGAGKMIENWHMSYLANEMQIMAERVFRGEKKEYDLIVNISPGTSKSSLASILFPCWVWTRMPHARILTASHTDNLVMDLANKSRWVIRSDKYRGMFPEIEFQQDQNVKSYYANTHGGSRMTCTVGGRSPMGMHCHFFLVDDAIDPKKAVSEAELRTAREFYDAVIPGRKINKEVSVEITIMQRLHAADPTGHLLERAKREGTSRIKHICIPAMLAENVSPPELAANYVDGLMDPTRLSAAVLKREQATMSAYAFAGQFQQNPVTLGGGMFRLEYFNQRVKAAPYHAKRIRAIDRAATEGGGCATAGVLMAKDTDGNYYIEDIFRGQWEPDKRDEQIVAAALRDRTRYGPNEEPDIYIEHEPGSSGVDAYRHTARKLAGFRVFPDRPSGKKEVRAEPLASQFAAKNVYLVEDGRWDIQGFIEECCLFPMGKFKDRVDAASMAFNRLATQLPVQGLKIITLGTQKRGQLRIVVCTVPELSGLEIEHSALLLTLRQPGYSGDDPIHDLRKILDKCTLCFADVAPEELQSDWPAERPVEGYGRPVGEILFTEAIGKRLWQFLTRKRDYLPEVIVIAGDGEDRRAISVAYAVSDTLGLVRSAIYQPSEPDLLHDKREAPNKWLYTMVRQTRAKVC